MLDTMLRRPTAAVWFFLLLFVLYAATALYSSQVPNDVHSAAHAAWSLATRGTLELSGAGLPYGLAWSVPVDGGEVSNRFPGVILAGIPLYLLMQPVLPTVAPSSLAAAASAAVGVTAALVGLRRLVPLRWAWGGAAALGLGTGVWSVGADALWTHGVTTAWLGLVFMGLTLGPLWRPLVLVSTAGAVLTRPHLSVALVVAALVLWRRRDPGAAVSLALGVAMGSVMFLVYGRLVFGSWSLMGPYQVYDHTDAAAAEPTSALGPVLWRLENVALALVSPRVGILQSYPTVALVAWAALLRWRRRTAPPAVTPPAPAHRSEPLLPTAVALAAASVAYGGVSLLLTRVSGGYGFWGNRTLIESVVLAWPLAVWLLATYEGGRLWRGTLALTVAWSVFFHALGAVSEPVARDGEGVATVASTSVWFWQVPMALAAGDWRRTSGVLLLAAAGAVVTWRLMRPGRDGPYPASARGRHDGRTVRSVRKGAR